VPAAVQLYILNDTDVFFGFYPITRQTIPLPGGDTDIYDLMGKDAVVFHHSLHSGQPTDLPYVQQARAWFALPLLALALAACGSSGPKVVFPTPADGAVSTGVSPTGKIINLGLPPLHNSSGASVRITSVRLTGQPKTVHLVSVTAYRWRQVGLGELIGAIGDLPRTCPSHFRPHKVTDAVTAAHADSAWMVVVSVRFSQPGRYHFRRFRLAYTTGGQSGWQYANLRVNVTAVQPHGKVDPTACP
jgi:hypothetical protein